jgi:hypothetical protein
VNNHSNKPSRKEEEKKISFCGCRSLFVYTFGWACRVFVLRLQLDKKNDGRECQKDVVTQQVANCLFLPAGRGRRPKTTRHPSRVDQRSITPDILCLRSVYQFDSVHFICR